jgi:AraC family transcriptional regulator, regulatory protein of adaptative response / methylated-DNA-[protein]-cysteine methyltransferase
MSVDGAISAIAGPAERRWEAVLDRRYDAEDPFVYAVTTTGVYCRPGCASRLPRRRNVRFFTSPADAERAGFRPCRRCRPDGDPPLAVLIERATALLDGAETAPSLQALSAELEVSPKTVVRAFEQQLGISPKAFIQARRRERLKQALGEETRVTDAIYAAGYGAASRFYSESQAVLGMQPKHYRAKGAGLVLRWATSDCPLGRVLVAATDKGVAMIAFRDDDRVLEADMAARFDRAERLHDVGGLEPLLAQVVAAIEEPAGASAIPLDIRGTAFQQRVWAALRAIPLGQTRRYAEIAAASGAPEAVRAVANACAGNPAALVVPCHRVLPKDGDVGGYRWGPERKRWLLRKERALTD